MDLELTEKPKAKKDVNVIFQNFLLPVVLTLKLFSYSTFTDLLCAIQACINYSFSYCMFSVTINKFAYA